ncbi:MAG: hypothetical protein QOJ69_1134 [Actinomycetota bacterium]|nr:hypothetical protein [Actinomycetota bacterium]
MKRMAGMLLVGALALAGCGSDDDKTAEGDWSASTGSFAISGLDTGFGNAGVASTPLSAAEGDRFLSVAVGKDGKVYGVGFVAPGGDQAMAVGRIKADGTLDTTFSDDGIATVNVADGGKAGEQSRGVAVQSTGKVVVAGPFEHDPKAAGDAARDTDIAVTRFDPSGKLDASFGAGGTTKVDLSTGLVLPPAAGATTTANTVVGDTMWGLTVLPDDKLIAVGATPAKGEGRTDLDFAIMRFTADGALDPSFGTAGVLTVDVDGGNESPRQAVVQPDGKVVVSGYTRTTATPAVVHPALVRLMPDGTLDQSFGKGGVAGETLLPAVAEAYEVGMQGDRYVITGYGRATADEKVDLIAARFTADGQWDKTFGTDGLVRIDVAHEDDRGRDLVALPDGRILIAGSGKPDAANIDAMLVLLDENGVLDPGFGTGGTLQVDLGGPADSFFGVALTPDGKHAIVTGYKGTEPATGDDAVVARVAVAAT